MLLRKNRKHNHGASNRNTTHTQPSLASSSKLAQHLALPHPLKHTGQQHEGENDWFAATNAKIYLRGKGHPNHSHTN
jgi:hypothetical protein